MKTVVIQIIWLLLLFPTLLHAALHDNGNGIVTDNETRLIWQQNGSASAMTWQDALAYCAELNLGGDTDWRLPNRNELQSIIDYEQYGPAVDSTIFPNTIGTFWTSTTQPDATDNAYVVNFTSGRIIYADKDTGLYYVRAVRGGVEPTPEESPYTRSDEGLVTDAGTDLVWAAVLVDTNNDSLADEMTWEDALAYCATLNFGGHTDWRLPSRHELQSIIDYRRYNPAVDTSFFPAVIGTFWTSTTPPDATANAYVVNFTSGRIIYADKDTSTYKILAVRGGVPAVPKKTIFYDNEDGTVTDSRNGLVWRKAPLDSANDGTLSWQEALAGSAALDSAGQGDWRLPDRNELQSIVDYHQYSPSIDTDVFPQVLGGRFWTATTSPDNVTSAYTVDFTGGRVSTADKDSKYSALVVRGRQDNTQGELKIFGIPDQVTVDEPFTIELVAEDSSFKTVTLDIEEGGGVKPDYVIVDGSRWKGNITVTRPGRTRLTASSDNYFSHSYLKGSSDWFEVEKNPDANVDLQVSIVESKVTYTPGDSISYSIYVKNFGQDPAYDIDIDVSYTDGYKIGSIQCSGNDTKACRESLRTDNLVKFKAVIFPGQYVHIKTEGNTLSSNQIELAVTAFDPITHKGDSAESSIYTGLPDRVQRNRETLLQKLPGSSNTPTISDTVVLTHGLQPASCIRGDLWTHKMTPGNSIMLFSFNRKLHRISL
ncbi:MAG: DUF1566 domain-containing protein [Candidatus Electrothrix sp. AW3_4]|nr:DUF1566 domain-containing protein [Candidatus Electrothrix gigas]